MSLGNLKEPSLKITRLEEARGATSALHKQEEHFALLEGERGQETQYEQQLLLLAKCPFLALRSSLLPLACLHHPPPTPPNGPGAGCGLILHQAMGT